MADMSACVYGCSGCRKSVAPVGQLDDAPRYMTATRSLMCSTTPMLWAMNR